MKLLTKEIEKNLPALYETEDVSAADKELIVKFFTPWTSWTWYGAEYDPKNKTFFGYVDGLEGEWGYFSLPELEEINGPFGLKIERDKYWTSTKFSELNN